MFPKLPVLDVIQRHVRVESGVMKSTAFVCVQHVLRETGSLLEKLIQMGASPENIHLLGKPYSSNLRTQEEMRSCGVAIHECAPMIPRGAYEEGFVRCVRAMWSQVSKELKRSRATRVIVVDDGGFCLRNVPEELARRMPVCGVEQTSSGLEYRAEYAHIPVVPVATSAAKRFIEPPIVYRAVADKLRQRLKGWTTKERYGVVGLGNVGQRVASELIRLGVQVTVHDKDPRLAEAFVEGKSEVRVVGGMTALLNESNVVFGCTGRDVFAGYSAWDELDSNGEMFLVSCSSGDVEFRSLLKAGVCAGEAKRDLFASVQFERKGRRFQILEGGFPITFDRAPISAPLADIQVTRGLMLSAIVQMLIRSLKRGPERGLIMLSPELQQLTVQHWLKLRSCRRTDYRRQVLRGFSDLKWIAENSAGKHLHE